MTSSPKNKTVSAILPNYNYGKYLSERINQILNQTYPISELIILDDASTDNSIEIIKSKVAEIKSKNPELEIKIAVNKQNSGNVFSQWQKGIKFASSDYVWIAEADDVAKPRLLETAMAAFEDKDVVLSCVNSRYVDENSHTILKDNLRKIKDAFRKNILVYNTIPNVSAIVLKNQPKLIDYLEEAKKYRLSGDWYFYIRISETGKIVYLNSVQNLHRLHKDSVTKNTNYKLRLEEMKAIHQYICESQTIAKKTKQKMKKLEKALAARWGQE